VKKTKQQPPYLVKLSRSPASTTVVMPIDQGLLIVDEYLDRHQRDLARYVLDQLTVQAPAESGPWIALLKFHLDGSEVEEALAVAEFVRKKFKDSEGIILACASVYERAEQAEKAIALLEKSLKHCKRKGSLLCNIGILYRTQGEKSAAIAMFERALAVSNNRNPHAYYCLTRILGSNASEEHLSGIENLLKSNGLNRREYGILQFSKAYFFENRDDEEYFKSLHKGNAALAEDHHGYFEHQGTIFNNVRGGFRRDAFRQSATASGQSDALPIFIAGLPRSGSTLLEQVLGAHSACRPVGESRAFTYARARALRELDTPSALDWVEKKGESIDIYQQVLRKLFEQHPLIKDVHGARIVDKSIENTKQIGMILQAYPQAKIIQLQRHPLDNILSCYHQCFEAGFNHLFNLEALAMNYRLYNDYMSFWQELFPGRILVVNYEELVAAPEKYLRDILNFCELDWEPELMSFHKQVGRVRTSTDIQIRQSFNTSAVGKWRRYREFLEPASALLQDEFGPL
jgi:tetratricopeptide (TPR) repeat protein